jgi:hypothetical protein
MLALAVVPGILSRAEAGSDDCSGCALLGSLSVTTVSIEPAQPLVGETIAMTFSVDYRLPGGPRCDAGECYLVGGEPYLEGNEPLEYTEAGIVVRKRVVQAGTTTVEFRVRTMTEEQCYYQDPETGCEYYFRYAFIEASSGPVGLQLVEPTPTPSDTPTPTATPPPRQETGSGCSIGDRRSAGSVGAAATLLLLALVARRPFLRRIS